MPYSQKLWDINLGTRFYQISSGRSVLFLKLEKRKEIWIFSIFMYETLWKYLPRNKNFIIKSWFYSHTESGSVLSANFSIWKFYVSKGPAQLADSENIFISFWTRTEFKGGSIPSKTFSRTKSITFLIVQIMDKSTSSRPLVAI